MAVGANQPRLGSGLFGVSALSAFAAVESPSTYKHPLGKIFL